VFIVSVADFVLPLFVFSGRNASGFRSSPGCETASLEMLFMKFQRTCRLCLEKVVACSRTTNCLMVSAIRCFESSGAT
jgi:delta-aminolevulinic acid dehydratase/porphobilinogen synthase